MPRGNPSNLVVPTSEQARKNGAAGGYASQAAQRKKKLLRDHLIELMEMKNPLILDENGEPQTNAAIMAIKAIDEALKGDWKAWELVRDTAGQKPIERMVIADVDAETLAEVERMVEGIEEE